MSDLKKQSTRQRDDTELLQEAKADAALLCAERRRLHTIAETGFELSQTLMVVEESLRAAGIRSTGCGKAGLTALIGGKRPGKTVLLRADMDALPIAEESGLPFAAHNGNMHACGHDMHTAMLLGAARLLKRREADIPGSVKLMFQGAEEILAGAKDMMENGVLENPRPDAAFMLHVMTGRNVECGTLIVPPPGLSAPASDFFDIRVRGKGCHGAAPEDGIDALYAAAQILLALQGIQARELPAFSGAVLSIGTFHGGDAPNAIAGAALLQGTLRSYTDEHQGFLKERLVQLAQGTASALRAGAQVEFTQSCPAFLNDAKLCEAAKKSLASFAPGVAVLDAAQWAENGGKRGGGSEDFACISREIPTLVLSLAAGDSREGYAYPLHHPKVRFDEATLPVGAAAYAQLALGYLQS